MLSALSMKKSLWSITKTHTHTHVRRQRSLGFTHTLTGLEMRGPPLSSVQSAGELGISSKTPAAFSEDIICVSNSLQTLQMLLQCVCVSVSVFVCTHFSGVIKLPKLGTNCSQVQILWDKMIFLHCSPLCLHSLLSHLCSYSTLSSHLLFPSSHLSPHILLRPYPVPFFSFHHALCSPPSLFGKTLHCRTSVGQRNGSLSLYVQNRLLPTRLGGTFSSPISKPVCFLCRETEWRGFFSLCF